MSTEYLPYFELKEVNEDGTFVGIASIYGIEDLGGDVIDKGAFKKTISENPIVPILWHHDAKEVIGEGTVKEWQGKILLEGRLDLEDTTGAKAYRKLKARLIKGLSIGFTTIKHAWEDVEGKMIRHISELKLWEVSIVTFPMLPAAQVTRVKQMADRPRRRMMDAMKEMEAVMSEHEKGSKDFKGKHEDAMEEMRAAMQALEDDMKDGKQVQALQATKDATPQEPAQAKEPQQQQSIEPGNHSELLQQLKESLQWSSTTTNI